MSAAVNEVLERYTSSLIVNEAYTSDVGRGCVRIEHDTMDFLHAITGDIIEIVGKRRTVARCMPLYPMDERKGITRIDAYLRENARVLVGDKVIVRKIDGRPAEKVVLSRIAHTSQLSRSFIISSLLHRAVVKDDKVVVPFMKDRLV